MKFEIKKREKLFLVFLTITILVGVQFYLTAKTLRKTRNLHELYERVSYSSASFYNPEANTALIFDGNYQTAWSEEPPAGSLLKHGRLKPTSDLYAVKPDPRTLQLTLEVGLTHYPERPPRANPIHQVIVYNGNQRNETTFRENARLARVQLLFFRQKLIDMDREYSHPPEPEFWHRQSFTLADRPGAQIIELMGMPPIDESPKFHKNIYMIWFRIVPETFYPGERYKNRIAVTEIELVREIPEPLARQQDSLE